MKKEYKHYLIITFIILLVVLATTRFSYLFGSDTDWINQHTVFPEYFRNMFYETGKLIPNFTFNLGAGQNMFNYSYYGFLSPIYLLSYLFPFLSMTAYTTIINIIITIISSILFYKWISNHGYKDKVALLSTIIFVLSECFIFHMHRHIMFVNYMPFLIMALMGIDSLIKNNKKTLLIVSVFLMILTSYYYSVCGLLVISIYYLYEYLDKKKFSAKTFIIDALKYMGYILLAVLLSAFYLMPTAYVVLSGRNDAKTAYSLIELLTPYVKVGKIFCGTYAVGISLIGLIALLYLIFTKKKSAVITSSITLFILLMPIFRYILNGGLYLREKCFIPFLPLLAFFTAKMIYDLFNDKVKTKKLVIYLLIVIGVLYLFNLKDMYFLFAFAFILFIPFLKNKYVKTIFSIFIVTTLLVTTLVKNYKEEVVSFEYYNDVFDKSIEKEIDEINTLDTSFYRTINLKNSTKTVNKIYNSSYLTTSTYSSSYNYDYLNFMREVFKTSTIDYNYFLQSASDDILFNNIMGVKYVVSDYNPGVGYIKLTDDLYQNTNAFPLMYTKENIISEEEFDKLDYFKQIEALLNNIVVSSTSNNPIIKNSFTKINLDYETISQDGVEINENEIKVKDKGKIVLKLNEPLINKLLYIKIDGLKENSCSYDNISMKINNIENILTCKTWIYKNKNNTFRFLLSDEKIDTLNIEFTKGTYNIDNIEYYIVDFNELDELNKNVFPVDILEMRNDSIKASVSLENDSVIASSIPYDEGFKIYDNGKEIEKIKVNKSFLGYKLSKGEHNIEIKYSSPYLKEGIISSIIGLLIMSYIIISDVKKKNKVVKKEEM